MADSANVLAFDSGICGLGKMWDATRAKQNPDGTARSGGVSLGATFGALAFVLVLVVLFWHGRAFTRDRRSSDDWQQHSQTVDRQGAKSVNVSLETSAGEFTISGVRATFSTRTSSTAIRMERLALITT